MPAAQIALQKLKDSPGDEHGAGPEDGQRVDQSNQGAQQQGILEVQQKQTDGEHNEGDAHELELGNAPASKRLTDHADTGCHMVGPAVGDSALCKSAQRRKLGGKHKAGENGGHQKQKGVGNLGHGGRDNSECLFAYAGEERLSALEKLVNAQLQQPAKPVGHL